MSDTRLLVVVPAWNEARSVAGVVSDAISELNADVVVIDDHSSDNTGEVALQAGATVLRLPFNLGVGGAVRTGLRYAQENGYERVVQLDGDGQHNAADLKALLGALDSGADLVVGSRFASGYRVPVMRRAVMRLLARVVSMRLGTAITDATSGYRAAGRRAVELFAESYPVDYLSDTVETLLIAADAGLKVTEIDVHMTPRQWGKSSSSSWRSMYHLLRLLLIVALHDIRKTRNGGTR